MTFRYFSLFVLTLLFVATTMTARAYPTLWGDSGIVLVPTADVTPFTSFDVAFDYTRVTGTADTTAAAFPVRLNYGIAKGVELSGVYAPTGENGFSTIAGNIKALLTTENFERHYPAIAVGGRFIDFSDSGDSSVINAYGTASMRLAKIGEEETGGYQVRGHLGVEYLRYSDTTTTDFVAPFVGVSYENFSGVTIALDYLPSLEANGATFRRSTVSGVVRLPLSEGFSLEFGGTRPFAMGDSNVFAGFNYHYGEESKTPDRSPTILY